MKKITRDKAIFFTISYGLVICLSIFCLLPFILVISGSLSSQESILIYGYSLFPRDFSLEAYKLAFMVPESLLRAYGVTMAVTIVGTSLGLFITAMTGYVLSRKDFDWRNRFAFFFYFTTLFSGGLVPWYILCVKYLKFNDNFLALFLPSLLNVFYILVMKSFMNAIPEAISESAKIDGANDFRIFAELIMPLSKPALATIGLFIALGFWNDWYFTYMFIQNDKMFTLQYYLYKIVVGADMLAKMGNTPGNSNAVFPTEALKMALTVITTGPILLLYPSVQKYFVSGITIGAVKG